LDSNRIDLGKGKNEMMEQIKGIILDYGGTIDSNGIHWAEVMWRSYLRQAVPIDEVSFREAYKFGERALGTRPLINATHNFWDVLYIKYKEQQSYLVEQNILQAHQMSEKTLRSMADESFEQAREAIRQATATLDYLGEHYPLVLVSNFYGNIQTILKDFGIESYFKAVVESAVVGVRKPDAAIFQLGVDSLEFSAQQCVVIGDSYTKDIAPAKSLGCKTIWLKKIGWGDDPNDVSDADKIIDDFKELQSIL
jgi:HAD superfamily hydrolase (TIGR01509 family)